MKVVVSGLTAAGKTTASKLLAERFEVPYFSASEVLRRLTNTRTDYWTPDVDTKRTPITDAAVDSEMIRLLDSEDSGVFDAWGLPWFSNTAATRIWLESDHSSRQRKCYVSWLERGQEKSFEECDDIVRAKDSFSRELFMREWGFDMFTDRAPFDLELDLSLLIPEATSDCAQRGVRETFEFLEAFVLSVPVTRTRLQLQPAL